VGRFPWQETAQLVTVHPWHDDVRHDEADASTAALVQKRQCSEGVRRLEHVKAVRRERARRNGAYLRVVIHHEDGSSGGGPTCG
jgi:hypothetical protein